MLIQDIPLTPEQKSIMKLEKDVHEILVLVKKMYLGLYGDPENNLIGVIEKQKLQEKEIELLKAEIVAIKSVNHDQSVAIGAKKTQREIAIEWTQKILRWAIEIAIITAVLRGIIGIDALIK